MAGPSHGNRRGRHPLRSGEVMNNKYMKAFLIGGVLAVASTTLWRKL